MSLHDEMSGMLSSLKADTYNVTLTNLDTLKSFLNTNKSYKQSLSIYWHSVIRTISKSMIGVIGHLNNHLDLLNCNLP